MKVIVFTMAYNASQTISRTIESILNQTFTNFEYYILDNASTDDTGKIIGKYQEKDGRIHGIRVNKNDPPNGGAFFHTLTWASDADYIVWCDADDTYTSDFLENMVRFSTENNLDIAACGYNKIDGETGEIIKHRALERNLVLYDELFTEEFIKYRGFTSFLWGKLYSIPFLREKGSTGTVEKESICNDSMWSLRVFKKAKKAGIYGKAMYNYYQYPKSLSNMSIEFSIKSYYNLWQATKEYLEQYGPISKPNKDFLYAISLSLAEEQNEKIFSSNLDTNIKLKLLDEVYGTSLWKETMQWEADPMFHNLAARTEYIKATKEKIENLPDIEKYPEVKERLFSYFFEE